MVVGVAPVYLATAWWLAYVADYHIGDSLARTAFAHHVVLSRDPHLGAIGFYWLPLPTVVQIPFVLVAARFHQAFFAGPLSTVVTACLAVPFVAGITRELGLTRRLQWWFTAVYALNPVTVFVAANGMSEAASFLSFAVAMYGYARWLRVRTIGALVVMATGLALGMTVRYETILLALLLAGCVTLQVPRPMWKRTLALVLLPTAYLLVLWLGANRLIMRDALFWYQRQKNNGRTPTDAAWLPHPYTFVNSARYCARLGLSLAPLLLLAPLVAAVRPRLAALKDASAIVAGGVFFPAFVLLGMVQRTTYADARYFYPSLFFAWMLAAWIAARLGSVGGGGRLAAGALAALAVLGALVPTVALANPRTSGVEGENTFFGALAGRRLPAASDTRSVSFGAVRATLGEIDAALPDHRYVLTDTTNLFSLVLLSRHPERMIIPDDRDFQAITDSPQGRVDLPLEFVIRPTAASEFTAFVNRILSNDRSGRWVQVDRWTTPLFTVFRWIPGAAPATP